MEVFLIIMCVVFLGFGYLIINMHIESNNIRTKLVEGSPYYKVIPVSGGKYAIEKTIYNHTHLSLPLIPLTLRLYDAYDTIENAEKDIKHLKSLD